jgi:hypothetical protein
MIQSLRVSSFEKWSTFAFVMRDFVLRYGMPKTACYPSCGYDSTPSEVFENVQYFDIDEMVCEFLRAKGLTVTYTDVLTLEKQNCDLLILVNPVLTVGEILATFSPRFVICNNLHETADDLIRAGLFRLVNRYVGDYFLVERE